LELAGLQGRTPWKVCAEAEPCNGSDAYSAAAAAGKKLRGQIVLLLLAI
jgi:hypothetical protein